MPVIPRRISSHFRSPVEKDLQTVESALRLSYFSSDSNLDAPEGTELLQDHLHRRLDHFRRTIIPWLSGTMPLMGARVLEIGCGTGSSTVALAEQGAEVFAVDMDERSLKVARARCRVYDLKVNFKRINAAEVHRVFTDQEFELIIFFAVLEHMTSDERLISMRNTWRMLKPGAWWCLVDTPNRLWIMDGHTSHLPFFHWLPDDIALGYSRFSSRAGFNRLFKQNSRATREKFLRQGRGISYHEFALAMEPVEQLDVVSSLPIFLRRHNPLRWIAWKSSLDSRYESMLRQAGPRIHRGFYQPSLDLLVRKA